MSKFFLLYWQPSLVPIKFQVNLIIIKLKVLFLRWVVSPTFGTKYGFGCQNLCISWSGLQENTIKVLCEGGPYSMNTGFKLLKARIAEYKWLDRVFVKVAREFSPNRQEPTALTTCYAKQLLKMKLVSGI